MIGKWMEHVLKMTRKYGYMHGTWLTEHESKHVSGTSCQEYAGTRMENDCIDQFFNQTQTTLWLAYWHITGGVHNQLHLYFHTCPLGSTSSIGPALCTVQLEGRDRYLHGTSVGNQQSSLAGTWGPWDLHKTEGLPHTVQARTTLPIPTHYPACIHQTADVLVAITDILHLNQARHLNPRHLLSPSFSSSLSLLGWRYHSALSITSIEVWQWDFKE